MFWQKSDKQNREEIYANMFLGGIALGVSNQPGIWLLNVDPHDLKLTGKSQILEIINC